MNEFDPFFTNARLGWHKRPLREYCKVYFDKFSNLQIEDFHNLILSFLINNFEVESSLITKNKKDFSESIAKRLATGLAAENYFSKNYLEILQFENFNLLNTTAMACGYDFKVFNNFDFYCIEVKGVSAKTGSILLTEKEFYVANHMKEKFCLYIVTNFIEKPNAQYFFDPLNSRLNFERFEKQIVQTNYLSKI